MYSSLEAYVMLNLTELRGQLFVLADRVLATGEPLLIERNGAHLKLVRADADSAGAVGRLAKLKTRDIVIGQPLDPHESPARWSELAWPDFQAAEPALAYGEPAPKPRSSKRRSRA
jgi:hypothetical protein